jgi:hypothetical protein
VSVKVSDGLNESVACNVVLRNPQRGQEGETSPSSSCSCCFERRRRAVGSHSALPQHPLNHPRPVVVAARDDPLSILRLPLPPRTGSQSLRKSGEDVPCDPSYSLSVLASLPGVLMSSRRGEKARGEGEEARGDLSGRGGGSEGIEGDAVRPSQCRLGRTTCKQEEEECDVTLSERPLFLPFLPLSSLLANSTPIGLRD